MPYDRSRHHRRSIRLPAWDYAHPGAYFVTVCTYRRECTLAGIIDGEVHLSVEGEIARRCWYELPVHYPHAELDAFVIMPNHVHGIIVITEGDGGDVYHGMVDVGFVGAGLRPAPTDGGIKRHGLPEIVCAFKSFSARRINEMRKTPGAPVWQRNYYERTVRNERELRAVREYIHRNPYHWVDDPDNPENII